MHVERWPQGKREPEVPLTQLTLKETMNRYRARRNEVHEIIDDEDIIIEESGAGGQEEEREALREGLCMNVVQPKSPVVEGGRWQWLIDRRDAEGRRPEDIDFDPRTLYIPDEALDGMTKFVSQFWSIKRNNFDMVLFVRVGSFYELYDEDADVGLKIGLKPMGTGIQKVNMWKVGCRASSFDLWCMKVLSSGHAVGRVEEVHGVLLKRELVQVYTPGTCRIACWNFDADSQERNAEGTPTLLALCESGSATDGLVGACLIDIDTAMLRIAQWQEVDQDKSTLSRVLSDTNPFEIVCRKRLSQETRRVLSRYRPLVTEGIDCKASIRFLRVDSERYIAPQGPGFDAEACMKGIQSLVEASFGVDCAWFSDSLRSCGVGDMSLQALEIMIHYLKDTKIGRGIMRRARVEKMIHFSPSGAAINGTMMLDGTALKTLEILQGSLGTVKGSLYEFLVSEAMTCMGKRCIWKWLVAPLFRDADIQERLLAVDTFRKVNVEPLVVALQSLSDIEKLMPVVAQQLSQLDLKEEGESLLHLAGHSNLVAAQQKTVCWGQIRGLCTVIRSLLYFSESYLDFMESVSSTEDDLLDKISVFQRSREACLRARHVLIPMATSIPLPSADLTTHDPVILPEGIWFNVDSCAAEMRKSQDRVEEHVKGMVALISSSFPGKKNVTGKIRMKREGEGACIECPKAMESYISSTFGWIPFERTRTGILYRDNMLVELSMRAVEEKQAYNALVYQVICIQGNRFLDEYASLLNLCHCIGELDALASFGFVTSIRKNLAFTRPQFKRAHAGVPCLQLTDAWNPQMLSSSDGIYDSKSSLVTNSICIGDIAPSTLLISGANSGGKTTFLKTVCIATIMAQIGCYVPCSEAIISPVSRIMTRMGARDRIAAGESTFAIEMKETSAILNSADKYSLAILDELGRGTSPQEGESIAWAVLKTLCNTCRVLFATHYHSLNSSFEGNPMVGLHHVPLNTAENVANRFKLLPGTLFLYVCTSISRL